MERGVSFTLSLRKFKVKKNKNKKTPQKRIETLTKI